MKSFLFLICISIYGSILASHLKFYKSDEFDGAGVVQLSPREFYSDSNSFIGKTSKNYHAINGEVSTEIYPRIDLQSVLLAIRKLLMFFLHDFQHLNLDAIIGTRIAEGQLKVLLRRLATESSDVTVPPLQLNEIYQLMMLSMKISEMTIPNLMVTSPGYYANVGRLIDEGFWELNYPTRKTNPRFVYPVVLAEEAFNETISDKCLSELMGTGQYQGHPCSPSDECWDIMTTSERSRYSLTHQIIFLQVGKVMGCEDEMKAHIEKRNQVSIGHMGETYCANVLREMKENYAKGLTEKRQDLFMEQAAICGMLGFNDFFTMQWLEDILSWQKPEGCYGSSGQFVDYYDHSKPRVKREEKKLKDGCLSHKSAVAVSALALYVRYLIEDPTLAGNIRLHFA